MVIIDILFLHLALCSSSSFYLCGSSLFHPWVWLRTYIILVVILNGVAQVVCGPLNRLQLIGILGSIVVDSPDMPLLGFCACYYRLSGEIMITHFLFSFELSRKCLFTSEVGSSSISKVNVISVSRLVKLNLGVLDWLFLLRNFMAFSTCTVWSWWFFLSC